MGDDVALTRRAAQQADRAEIQAISDWLVAEGLRGADFAALFGGFCERLASFGVKLWRGQIAMRTLHPTIESIAYTWRPAEGVRHTSYLYSDGESEDFRNSPFHHLLSTGNTALRQSLEGDGPLPFPILEAFRAAGASDYYARLVGFRFARDIDQRNGLISSWATDRPGGFEAAEIATLDRLLPRLALSLKSILAYQVSVNLLNTYVGPDAGRRIMGGHIRRGSAEVIRAVLLFADLRGFTALSESAPRDDLLATLDAYFDCMIAPLADHGGQVLKFLGDGLLATFDLAGRDRDSVCHDSLAAAVEALAAVRALNAARAAAGAPVLDLDIAVHLGDVLYGNIGARDRQDFTVIGPAVNEASRIEALCGPLGTNLLLSEAFARQATGCAPRLVSVGRHRLRGISAPQELFTVEGV